MNDSGEAGSSERERFVAAMLGAGHELWVVGGAVRDRLMGGTGKDEDFATSALPDVVEETAKALGRHVTVVGKRFGTIGVLLDGRWSEVTTFRGDSYSSGTRWPDVTFGTSLREDLQRRDFTVNAIAEHPVTGELRDLFEGRRDLEAKLLRAVGEPHARFVEDPLRILRGIRFVSQLGFEVEEETLAAMGRSTSLLATLSQERITAELDRLLCGSFPAEGLELLRETGAFAMILPELAPMVGCEQNRFHKYDVWGHTVATVGAIPNGSENLRLRRWAALVHDLGKPYVRHTKPSGEWGFYAHEKEGAERAEALLERLKLSRKDVQAVSLMVRRHMDRPNVEERRSVRRFMSRSVGHWDDLIALKRADNASHTYDDREYHDALQAMCDQVAEEDGEALRAQSPLSGDDIASIAGRPPGAWIRPLKERLSAMVLDGEIEAGDRVEGERVVRVMLSNEGKP